MINCDIYMTQTLMEQRMRYCSNCAASIDVRAKICPKCGIEQLPLLQHVSSAWYLVPLFFGFIGLSVVIEYATDFLNIIPLILALTILAVLGKVIGCGLGAKIYRFSNRESYSIGCAMCGRGALELVLLSFGRSINLIDDTIFTALVMVTILTVIITPLLFTLMERRIKS